ncbi:hypothetical protein [Klebsiella aerogenes]|uniref:hypothetical protein n=1 Tax=Klebsiella aerogenes TaxID=548 RepID=UPI003A4E19CA
MTKSTITRERAEQLANFKGAPVTRQEEQELARMALAAMDSEPVAEITEDLGRLFVKIHSPTILRAGDKLYRHAQPAPAVPDEVTAEDCPALVKYDVTEVDEAWARGFNAYRAAMLQAEPVTTANKLREGIGAIRNSGTPIDDEKIQEERDSLNSPAIPDGYVMVPKEVTLEISNAINAVGNRCTCGNCSQRLWDLLLAAAPQEVK